MLSKWPLWSLLKIFASLAALFIAQNVAFRHYFFLFFFIYILFLSFHSEVKIICFPLDCSFYFSCSFLFTSNWLQFPLILSEPSTQFLHYYFHMQGDTRPWKHSHGPQSHRVEQIFAPWFDNFSGLTSVPNRS